MRWTRARDRAACRQRRRLGIKASWGPTERRSSTGREMAPLVGCQFDRYSTCPSSPMRLGGNSQVLSREGMQRAFDQACIAARIQGHSPAVIADVPWGDESALRPASLSGIPPEVPLLHQAERPGRTQSGCAERGPGWIRPRLLRVLTPAGRRCAASKFALRTCRTIGSHRASPPATQTKTGPSGPF